jgi:CTD small phosphatase-like protein 2
MGKYYEIVIFTAALEDYADFILEIIDSKHQIAHRLYRHHTVPHGNSYVKVKKKKNKN